MIAERNSSIERKASLFWLARQTAFGLLREGHLDRAGEFIPYLLHAGDSLLTGSSVERVIGAAMCRSAEELSASLAAAR